MENLDPSLEDIISFMDEDHAGLNDPLDSDPVKEVETKDEPELDDDPDVDLDDEVKIPKDTEEKETSTEDDKEPIVHDDVSKLYKALLENKVLDPGEDFEFKGDLDSFNEAIDKTFYKLKEEAQNSLLNALDDDFKVALKYALTNKGGNLADFVQQYYSTPVGLEEIDLSDEDNQKYIVREYLKSTTSHSDDKIEKYIQRLEDLGTLSDEATDSLSELLQLQEKHRIEYEKSLEKAREQRVKEEEEERRKFSQIIDDAQYIQTTRKGKIKGFLMNTYQRRGEEPTTEFTRTLKLISSNPNHIVQLADLLMDYDPNKGFNFDRLAAKKSTKQVSKLRESIDSLFDPQGSSRGSASKPAMNDFDWEA